MPPLPPMAKRVSGPWPVLGRGSDKEGWALSGLRERAIGLSGHPELVSSLLHALSSSQISPAPTA